MFEAVLRVAEALKVAFGNDSERADRREHPAVVAVQSMQPFTPILDQLALGSARQINAACEWITHVVFARLQLLVAALDFTGILAPSRAVDMFVVWLARVMITRIEIHQTAPPSD